MPLKPKLKQHKVCSPAPLSPFSCLPGTRPLLLARVLAHSQRSACRTSVSCFMLRPLFAISFAVMVLAGKSPCGSPGKGRLSRRGMCSGAAPGTPLCLLPVSHRPSSLPCCFLQSFGQDCLILRGPDLEARPADEQPGIAAPGCGVLARGQCLWTCFLLRHQ